MILFRLLLTLAALGIAGCVAAYFVTGDRRWFGRALRVGVWTAVVALIFFGVLLVERLAAG